MFLTLSSFKLVSLDKWNRDRLAIRSRLVYSKLASLEFFFFHFSKLHVRCLFLFHSVLDLHSYNLLWHLCLPIAVILTWLLIFYVFISKYKLMSVQFLFSNILSDKKKSCYFISNINVHNWINRKTRRLFINFRCLSY